MRLHLTPSFEVTQDTIEVTHRYNSQTHRIYNMDFQNPDTGDNYDSIIIHVPFDITQPIEFYKNEYWNNGVEEGMSTNEQRYDEDEQNIIKELFYTFCHKHTSETPKYAYVHSITWHCNPSLNKTLPTELNIKISNMNSDNIYTEIQNILLLRFGYKPVSFSIITYNPYEESHYGVINVYPNCREDECVTHVYKHVNDKIESSIFNGRFYEYWFDGYEIAKYVSENLDNATTNILESNNIQMLETDKNSILYYIANENHSDFVSKEDFMATMHMTVTSE